MIQIVTVASRIVYSNEGLATGFLLVTPSEPFTYLEATDLLKKRVSMETLQVNFADGILSSEFKLAPTLNANQDKSNLYYKVEFFTNSSNWVEYWTIDAAGQQQLEFADVIRVVIEPQVSTIAFVSADDVSVVPGASKVVRSNSDGIIDLGWFSAVPLNMVINGYIGKVADFIIPNGTFAIISDTDDGQLKFWNGAGWAVIGSGTQNTALNSADPVQVLGYMGNPLPMPPVGSLALGLDVSLSQILGWDGEGWQTLSEGAAAPDFLVGDYIIVPVVGVLADPLPNLPQRIIALGFDTGESQRRISDGISGWHTIG